jgi:hypothetical protein
METSVGAVIVRVVEPVTAPEVAVMSTTPWEFANAELFVNVTAPAGVPAVAVQVTAVDKSAVVPSEYVPVAVNSCAVPSGIEALAGVTAMETSAAGPTVRLAVPDVTPGVAAVMVTIFDNGVVEVAKPGVRLLMVTLGSEEVQVTVAVTF